MYVMVFPKIKYHHGYIRDGISNIYVTFIYLTNVLNILLSKTAFEYLFSKFTRYLHCRRVLISYWDFRSVHQVYVYLV